MLKLLLSCSVACMIVFTAGCAGGKDFVKPDQTAIDAYIQANPDLPELDKSCIYDGRFEVGMRKETVRFLLGEPREKQIIQQPWAQQEKWIYKKGNFKIFYMEDEGVVSIDEND